MTIALREPGVEASAPAALTPHFPEPGFINPTPWSTECGSEAQQHQSLLQSSQKSFYLQVWRGVQKLKKAQ